MIRYASVVTLILWNVKVWYSITARWYFGQNLFLHPTLPQHTYSTNMCGGRLAIHSNAMYTFSFYIIWSISNASLNNNIVLLLINPLYHDKDDKSLIVASSASFSLGKLSLLAYVYDCKTCYHAWSIRACYSRTRHVIA